MDLHVLVGPRARVAEDSRIDRNMAGVAALTSCPDHPQGARTHTVDGPVGVSVEVADGNAEPSVVGSDDVEMKARATGDVELGVFTGIGSLVVFSPRRVCKGGA